MKREDIVAASAILPADVLPDGERARLAAVAVGRVGGVDAAGAARVVAFWASVAVWLPVVWSGSQSAGSAAQHEVGVLVLAAGAYGVLALAGSFVRSNAVAALRADAAARARLTPEQRERLGAGAAR